MRNQLELIDRVFLNFRDISEMNAYNFCAKYFYQTTEPAVYPKQLIKSLIKNKEYDTSIVSPEEKNSEHHGFYLLKSITPDSYRKLELEEAVIELEKWVTQYVDRSLLDSEGMPNLKREDMDRYSVQLLTDEISDGCAIYMLDTSTLERQYDYWASPAMTYYLELIVVSADNSSLVLLAYSDD